ncbi:hypothetical protein SAMN05444166_2920 [Singulisphaera sp. GP187]|nr:hypothetical protein SAMN05444166_2920 [Singulisphaera sp. GP187]
MSVIAGGRLESKKNAHGTAGDPPALEWNHINKCRHKENPIAGGTPSVPGGGKRIGPKIESGGTSMIPGKFRGVEQAPEEVGHPLASLVAPGAREPSLEVGRLVGGGPPGQHGQVSDFHRRPIGGGQ